MEFSGTWWAQGIWIWGSGLGFSLRGKDLRSGFRLLVFAGNPEIPSRNNYLAALRIWVLHEPWAQISRCLGEPGHGRGKYITHFSFSNDVIVSPCVLDTVKSV